MRGTIPALLCALLLIGCNEGNDAQPAAKPRELGIFEAQSLQSICAAANDANPEGISYGDRAITLKNSLAACDRLLSEYTPAKSDPALQGRAATLRARFEQYDRLGEVETLTLGKQFDKARRRLEAQRNLIGEDIYRFVSQQIKDQEAAQVMAQLDQKFPGLSPHAKSLHMKYAGRLTFKTAEAQQIVEGFNIDCRAADRRYLPLINVIYAKLAELDGDHAHLETVADSRDGEVRVIDRLISSDGAVMNEVIAYQIDKWNELYPRASRPEALRNACFSGWGEIWVIP